MTSPAMPELLSEIVAYCREAGHDWSSLTEAEHMLATLQAQQSTQGDTPAEVSDAEIERIAIESEMVFRSGGKLLTPFLEYIDLTRNVHAFARAILALRPQAVVAKAQVPMT